MSTTSDIPAASAPRSWSPWQSPALLLVIIALLFESASGIHLWMADDMGKAVMMVLLLHVAVGLLAVIPFLAVIPPHLRSARIQEILQSRVDRGVRNGAWVLLLISLVTGVHLFLVGATGYYWEWWLHIAVSYTGVLLLVVHVAYKQVVAQSGNVLHRLSAPVLGRALMLTLATFVVVFAGAAALRYGTRTVDRPLDYDALGPEALFAPGKLQATFTGVGTKNAFSNSRACGLSGCHEGLYKEWKESAHYYSGNQYFLRAAAELGRQVGGTGTVRHCTACHFPAATLTGNLNEVTNAQPDEATARRLAESDQASSCVLCHSLHEVRAAGGGANVIAEPAEFVFANADKPWLDFLYKKAVAMKPWTHAKVYTRPFYSETKACAGCHDRMQMEVWMRGAYFNRHDPSKTQHCQTCHMPSIALEDEVMTRTRGKTKSHRFLAGNLTIPTVFGLDGQAKATREYIADQKIQMELAAPGAVAAGKTFPLIVSMRNANVGHHYPAGPELDLVEAWVEIHVLDEKGKEVYATGTLDAKNHLAKNTYVYNEFSFDHRLRPVPRIYGPHHTTWHWMYGLMHVIAPLTVDDAHYQVPLPAGLDTKKLRVQVTLRQRRPSQLFLDWAFPGQTAPVMTVASRETEIPVSGDAAPVADASLVRPFAGEPRSDPYYTIQLVKRPIFVRDSAYQAMIGFMRGKQKEGLEQVEQLRKEYPDVYEADLTYAQMLIALGRIAEAEAPLQHVIAMAPNESRARTLQAQVAEAKGDTARAKELRADAERLEKSEMTRFFQTQSYKPVEIKPDTERRLRQRIDHGLYDGDFPYILVNRDRLKELPPDWWIPRDPRVGR